MDSSAQLALTYDPNWLQLWNHRFGDALLDAETFRLTAEGTLAEIGKKPNSVDQVEGQYMGLLRFTPKGWAEVTRVRATLSAAERDRMHMTGTLQMLIEAKRIPVHAISYKGNWGEIDSGPIYRYMKMICNYGHISQLMLMTPISGKPNFLSFDIVVARRSDRRCPPAANAYQASATLFATHSCSALTNILSEEYELVFIPTSIICLTARQWKIISAICSELKEHFECIICAKSLIMLRESDPASLRKIGNTQTLQLLCHIKNDNPLFPWVMWDGLIRVPYFL